MKIRELLDYIDDVRPNAFTEAQKLVWINELEARIQRDVLLSAELWQYELPRSCDDPIEGSCTIESGTGARCTGRRIMDEDKELILDPPHDAIYRHWMEAMIDYENGEYSKYQNSMQMFNAQWSSFVAWFAETYRPADGYRRM